MNGLNRFESIAVNLERDYKCSGFCMQNNQFVFTEATGVGPKGSCKDALVD
jgi:hypothetical protein